MGIIEFNNVEKNYGDKKIISGLNIDINNGDFVIITGSSGSGKSTLLNMIGLLDTPTGGQVNLFGKKSPTIGSSKWTFLLRNRISYLFQNYGLMEDETVEANLEIATHFLKLTKESKHEEMLKALDKVSLPNILNKKVYQLSGGEQQRVAIAKCFLKKSDIILADEPTGNLDRTNRDKIMDLFKTLNQMGKTIIIVTHDPELTQYASKVINLAVNV